MQYIKIFLSAELTVFAFMFDRIYDINEPLHVLLESLLVQLPSRFGQLLRMFAQLISRPDYLDITWCALTLILFAFYWKSRKYYSGFCVVEAIFSLFFSVFMLIGRSFCVCNSLEMLFAQKVMTLFAGIGWFVFFYTLLRWISCFVDKQYLTTEKSNGFLRVQLIVLALILLFWLPQWLICLPGNVQNDGMSQLSQWFRYYAPNDHHPWFMTMLFGFLMSIGRNISDNAGVFIIILFQFIFCAWAYSQVCLSVARYAGIKSAYYAGLFFAVVPLWGVYSATVVKDTIATAIFALYFCSFVDIVEGRQLSRKKWVAFGLLSLLTCLTRHEGIYIVLFTGAFSIFGLRTKRRQLVSILVGICIFLVGYNAFIFNVLGIRKGSVKDMLSIPFQQTARYSRDHGEDISEEEKNIIDKVLPYDELASVYDPDLSDPVKGKMKKAEKEDLEEYFRIWFNIGLRHPGTYLQATINNSYKYYYPFHRLGSYAPIYISENANSGLNIYYVTGKIKGALKIYDELWLAMPGISLLLRPGAYTWILLIGIMLLLKKRKYRELVVVSPLLMRIAICCASPVNGSVRYAMPLMACTPVLLAWLAHTLCSSGGDDNG